MTVETVVYRDAGVRTYDDVAAARDAAGTTWVRVVDADDGTMESVASAFDIHPLAVEDVHTGVRPKTEQFTGYTFVLVKAAELGGGETTFEEEVSERPIGLFIGDDWLVSMAPGADTPTDRVWNAAVRGDERLLARGPDFTAARVVDAVVDEYFDVLDRIENGIEEIEDAVLVSTDVGTLGSINDARRDLLSFRKLAWPTREALAVLSRGDPEQIRPETEKYYRDVYDHLVHVVDLIETYRDLVSGARDIYLNSLSQSTNEVMKTLTVVATVFLPLTFVVGVYGMNFGGGPYNMPELGWRFGYPAVMLGMLGIGGLMLWAFQRQGYV